jgi:glycosyltransferase involved in cell wall biosynthesis
MSKTPAISILTPVWNGLPYLKECVESALSQEFQDWEMIVADNCSNDGTTEYLRSLTDPRIKVFRHEKNLGVYRNIHFLFNNASAPIFVGLCADDYFLSTKSLGDVVDEWSKVGPDTGFITFNWTSRQQKHNRLAAYAVEALPNKLRGWHSSVAFFLFGCYPGNFSEMSGRVHLAAPEHANYNVRFSADYEYWMRLVKRSGIYLSSKDVVYIRRHDRVAATYAITKGEYHEESYKIYEKIIDDLSPFCSRALLIHFYNIELCSYHLRDAIKSATRGKFTALKSFMSLKSPIFWPTGLQTIGLLPFALSERLRFAVTTRLAGEILEQSKSKIMREGAESTPAHLDVA